MKNLETNDIRSLVRLMESSLRVRNQDEYNHWARYELAAVFRHQVMLSVAVGSEKPITHAVRTPDAPLSLEQIEEVFFAKDGLLSSVMTAWQEGNRPYLKNYEPYEIGNGKDTDVEIRRRGFRSIVAHGVEDYDGELVAFFCLSSVSRMLDSHQAYLLEMLIPHISVAFTRACVGDAAKVADGRQDSLTAREKEVMRWVKEGKSNWEISIILNISNLTVKNHLHNILRKLSAQSRGHAVAKAIEMKII